MLKFNEEFMGKLEKGWKVPIGIPENEQVDSVMEQMREIGLEPNREDVLEHVREVNASITE